MPALGYARRSGALTYGVGLFAQGGMGTDYGADTFLAMGSGHPVRSELGVGRCCFPLAWQVHAGPGDRRFHRLRLGQPGHAHGRQRHAAGRPGHRRLDGNLAHGHAATGAGALGAHRLLQQQRLQRCGQVHRLGGQGRRGVPRAAPGFTLGASYQGKTSLGDMKTGSHRRVDVAPSAALPTVAA
jgi:long-chain fatty acid transport protein